MPTSTLKQFIYYNIVGIANTLVGFSIVFGLMFVGYEALHANMIGYAIGAIVSFILNKKYTFKSTATPYTQAFKFFIVLGIAYILNYLTLQWLLGNTTPYLAQLLSAIVYTVSSFVLAKFFVFNE